MRNNKQQQPPKPEGFKLKNFIADQALDEIGRDGDGPAARLWKYWISKGGAGLDD